VREQPTAAAGLLLDQERVDHADVAMALQAALLPATLPVLPQARLAACYRAGHPEAAGGDWFDAVVRPDGSVALVVGDVVGHGTAAVVAMAQLRAVLADRLATSADLSDAFVAGGEFAARTPGLRAATAAVLALEPGSGQFWYATCGHPPPLLVAADGSAQFLPVTGSGPLGTGSSLELVPGTLGPDEFVLLYTNGLVSRPGRAAGETMAELAAAAGAVASRAQPAGAPPVADLLCGTAVDLAAKDVHDDVLALVVHRLAEPAPPLQLELPATLAALRIARRAMTAWLRDIGASAADRAAIQLGVSELILNAAEHAYLGDGVGLIGLDAMLGADGCIECRVTDHGSWRAPGAAADRGRGLMLIQHVLDDVVISHPPQSAGGPRGARGTMVTLRHRLNRPTSLAAAAGEPELFDDEVVFGVDAENLDGAAYAAVRGNLDGDSAGELTRELLAVSRGGTLALAVDLTGVTLLASAGVRGLFEVRSQLAAQHQPMSIIAAPGSSTAFVLDLVQLAYQPGPGPLATPLRSGRRRTR
jgi:anti-sigma regulatory factor (Ser/Thr protein kinase)/anti-anti-sigma regulatory factor